MSLRGPSAGAVRTIEADIADVAPTILYLLGQPLPSDLDGASSRRRSTRALLDRRPPEYVDEEGDGLVAAAERYSPEDAVEERLRSLGYLE